MGTRNPKHQPNADGAKDAGGTGAKKAATPRVKKKIPEPAKNLRQREEWFRKRSGS